MEGRLREGVCVCVCGVCGVRAASLPYCGCVWCVWVRVVCVGVCDVWDRPHLSRGTVCEGACVWPLSRTVGGCAVCGCVTHVGACVRCVTDNISEEEQCVCVRVCV